ncbi:kinase-like domain-containing protein [Echria macrotheca]|uniref:non-specific serine/threonine protein kinase n=1 Tax=Echria macrotheca TaxID=438768 RepID=A0AAJ0FDP6_9PEZI|nr:kinase-like domain-containing protein [Echria macrotheca]
MSFESEPSSSLLPVSDYLTDPELEGFVWDREGEETSEAWLAPVREAGLDHRKHKVFHHANKEYTTPPLPFRHDGELGQSGSTIVYRVRAPKGYNYRRPLALKVIVCKDVVSSRPPGPNSEARRLALQEVQNMAAIRHPHIVVYVASYEEYCLQTRKVETTRRSPRPGRREVFHVNQQVINKHILGIAMYPPAQCNLQTFMLECLASSRNPSQKSNGSQGLSQGLSQVEEDPEHAWWKLPFLHTYFGCLAQAVAYLHRSSVRIRHKDIKPENVVIDDFGMPVLTDFGLSTHFETGHHSDGPTAKTLKYADPEAMQGIRRDERSDIFSLGCVYLEMATVIIGRSPSFAEARLSAAVDQPAGLFKYSEALDGLDGYIAELVRIVEDELARTTDASRQASLRAIVVVLPTIGKMMHPDFTRRPYAQELYPLFRHLSEVPGTPGLCPTCEEERQTGRFTPKSGSQRSGRGSPTMTTGIAAAGASVSKRRTWHIACRSWGTARIVVVAG